MGAKTVYSVFPEYYKANETMVISDHLELLAQVEAEDDIFGGRTGQGRSTMMMMIRMSVGCVNLGPATVQRQGAAGGASFATSLGICDGSLGLSRKM
jgi:hypothetical protein